jgi:membrane protease subunit (stomatin/prohibitin family)
MGIRSLFKKQLSVVVEWKDQDKSLLFYKADVPTSEIKNASKLLVSPGQGCILVYEGKVQDVLTDSGMYFLETDNHPFITTFLKLRQAFESEHKMHLYFFRTAEVVNQPWGTANPVKYIDPVYKFPIQLGANGNFSVRISLAESLFANVVGSVGRFTTDDLREIVAGRISPQLTSYLAQSAWSYRDIDARLSEMSDGMKEQINRTIDGLGLELTDFRIESTTFDAETQERIERIAGMTAEALSAAEVGLEYVELEKLRALRDAAKNEGGLAGA